jgi:pimeloyl-ACP methyl ester carboxylesterase
MMAYYKANYPAPPYNPQTPAGYTFAVPSLIIWGTEEEYFAPGVLDGLARYYPASLRLVTVPGAGHWVHQDAARRVNAEIRSWLATVPVLRGNPNNRPKRAGCQRLLWSKWASMRECALR